MSFKRISIKVKKKVPVTKGGKTVYETQDDTYGTNINQISYWRGITGEDEEGKTTLKTMLFLVGNPKPIHLRVSVSDFERQLDELTQEDPTHLYKLKSDKEKIEYNNSHISHEEVKGA